MINAQSVINGLSEAERLIIERIPVRYHGNALRAISDAIIMISKYSAKEKKSEEDRKINRLASKRRYRELHPEKCAEYARKWRAKNKEKVKMYNKKYYEKKRAE